MKIQVNTPEVAYIEVNGYTIYVDASLKNEPPIVTYWEDDADEETTYTCQWVNYV